MEDKKEVTFFDLENRLEEALKTIDEDYSINKLENETDIDDRRQEALIEIIDGLIPIYNYDLLTVCGSNLWLGEQETGEGSRNAFECLREAIHNELYEKAQELLSKLNN